MLRTLRTASKKRAEVVSGVIAHQRHGCECARTGKSNRAAAYGGGGASKKRRGLVIGPFIKGAAQRQSAPGTTAMDSGSLST